MDRIGDGLILSVIHWLNAKQQRAVNDDTWRQQFSISLPLFIQFLPLLSVDDKAEAEPKNPLAKNYHCLSTSSTSYKQWLPDS